MTKFNVINENFYILTLPKRKMLGALTKYSLENTANIKSENIKYIQGFTPEDLPLLKKKHALPLRAFLNKFLPLALSDAEKGIGSWWVEDGSRFVTRPKVEQRTKINWAGYINRMKHYIVGAKCIYFPPRIIKDLYEKSDTVKDLLKIMVKKIIYYMYFQKV